MVEKKEIPINVEIGVVTFFSSHHAVQAETVLKEAKYDVALIPGPKEISPNCGVALQFDYDTKDEVEALLKEKGVKYEAVHLYKKTKKSLLDKILGNN